MAPLELIFNEFRNVLDLKKNGGIILLLGENKKEYTQ